MDDRTQPGRENAPPSRIAPTAPSSNDSPRENGRHTSGDERASADRLSSTKPALTDRERRERWPID